MAKLTHSFASSAITAAAYDTDRTILDIWYRGGDRYSYFEVPRSVYDQLCVADSAGEYVNREIKPRYSYEIEPQRRRFRPTD